MTLPPVSQLTSRIVPASTSRRNEATVTGITTSTTATIPAINIQGCITCSSKSEGSKHRNGAAVPGRIHLLHPQAITRAHPHPGLTLLVRQRREDLHDLPVQLHGYQSLSIAV